MLKLKDTPGFSGDNLVMTYPQYKQVGQHRDTNGFLTAVFIPTDLVLAQPQPRFQLPVHALDVIVTTHKTIDLVFHTQVYKLKRDMTRKNSASASSIAFMQNDVMEVNDETPAHSPATDCGRPAPVGAPPQGAHDHSGTPGEQKWKSHSMLEARPGKKKTKTPTRANSAA